MKRFNKISKVLDERILSKIVGICFAVLIISLIGEINDYANSKGLEDAGTTVEKHEDNTTKIPISVINNSNENVVVYIEKRKKLMDNFVYDIDFAIKSGNHLVIPYTINLDEEITELFVYVIKENGIYTQDFSIVTNDILKSNKLEIVWDGNKVS